VREPPLAAQYVARCCVRNRADAEPDVAVSLILAVRLCCGRWSRRGLVISMRLCVCGGQRLALCILGDEAEVPIGQDE
jgi:hypothetical protein